MNTAKRLSIMLDLLALRHEAWGGALLRVT
jgi:hypothetical protein